MARDSDSDSKCSGKKIVLYSGIYMVVWVGLSALNFGLFKGGQHLTTNFKHKESDATQAGFLIGGAWFQSWMTPGAAVLAEAFIKYAGSSNFNPYARVLIHGASALAMWLTSIATVSALLMQAQRPVEPGCTNDDPNDDCYGSDAWAFTDTFEPWAVAASITVGVVTLVSIAVVGIRAISSRESAPKMFDDGHRATAPRSSCCPCLNASTSARPRVGSGSMEQPMLG